MLETEKKYVGRILDINIDTITLPNGKTTYRESTIRGNAAAIIPIDKDNNIIFVRQYRHSAGQMMLEIPAGMLEDGEDPMVCAKRELEEEIGMRAGNIKFLIKNYPSAGFCTEQIYIYIATDLIQSVQNLDEDEFVVIEKYSLEQAYEMITNGEIVDSKTIIAILYYMTINM